MEYALWEKTDIPCCAENREKKESVYRAMGCAIIIGMQYNHRMWQTAWCRIACILPINNYCWQLSPLWVEFVNFLQYLCILHNFCDVAQSSGMLLHYVRLQQCYFHSVLSSSFYTSVLINSDILFVTDSWSCKCSKSSTRWLWLDIIRLSMGRKALLDSNSSLWKRDMKKWV